MSSATIAILGAGMSGLAASKALTDQDCVVYEARSHAGGHASSFSFDGFTFDEGPHVSFTSNERIKRFLAKSVGDRYLEHPSFATNYYQGHILKHPVQCNLRGLPPELISACLADFVRAQYEDKREVNNYRDWCYRGLGKTISETFTRLYTHKYWNLELEDLTTDWVSARVYAPKLEEVLDGALSEAKGQHYYMSSFRYPEQGGFQSYNNLLAKDAPVRFGARAAEIDLAHKRLTFEGGGVAHFEHLISSIPLPELIAICKDAPANVCEAAGKLACTSHFLVSVAVNRPVIDDAYWIYYYDEDIPFSRVSFPSKYSPHISRSGCSTMQAEIVHSRYKQLPSKEAIVEQCLDGLRRVKLLKKDDKIVAIDARDIRYANVIFDMNRSANLSVVHDYLRSHRVHWCGRYGDWEYLWTDQSILSGERAAGEVRASIGLDFRKFDEGV